MNYTRLLAQIKLRETQRQRDRLRKQYDAIEARVARADTPLERLRALYQGLREVTFAQKPLHPGVRELDALYLADELGNVPPELVADRTRFLERELAQGRLRAEFTYTFGLILYVVEIDLRDFYSSLSHELILEVLRRLGVPERWCAFFGKF